MDKLLKKVLKLLLPFFLGGFVLYWVYRDFDFAKAADTLRHGTNWGWMSVSLLFGILAQVFRGWRWQQTLAPLQAYPKRSNCVNAVFLPYAASLLIPRVGEVSRCGVLAKYDNISFAQSLGTVVTERLIDSLTILFITAVTVLLQLPYFVSFIEQTGTKIPSAIHLLTSVWFYVILLCIIGVGWLLYYMRKTLFFYERVKGIALNVWEGIVSLRKVDNMPLFIGYTAAIWICYFFHFYFTFFCFDFTAHLGLAAGLVMFVSGTFAVIVPTPNGAGSWHFAVISMLMLYGVNATDAGIFALIVHGIQTFLVFLLGIYAMAALPFVNKQRT